MMKRLIITILAGLSAFMPVLAQERTPDELRDIVISTASRISSVECDFVQTKKSSMLAEAAVSEGRMAFRRSGYLRWEYTSPFIFSLTVDNGLITMEKDGMKTVMDSSGSKLFKEMSSMISGSIDGSALTSGKMFRAGFVEEGGEIVVTLIPVKADIKRLWSKLVIRYDAVTLMAKSFEMQELSGDVTLIQFKNSRYEVSQ